VRGWYCGEGVWTSCVLVLLKMGLEKGKKLGTESGGHIWTKYLRASMVTVGVTWNVCWPKDISEAESVT